MKTCTKCNLLLPITKFPENRNTCNKCRNSKRKKWREYSEEYRKIRSEQIRKYREDNKEKAKGWARKRREANKETINFQKRVRRSSPEAKEKQREQNRNYQQSHKKELAAYKRTRRKEDSIYRLEQAYRNLVRSSFRRRKFTKRCASLSVLGCDSLHLYSHLVITALNRYGVYHDSIHYHIDHILPTASATSEEHLIELNHYSNLQLLYPEDNYKKGDKIK